MMANTNRILGGHEAAPAQPHILFVCGRNKWRSPTAERLYRNDPRILVRSAGVSEKSGHTISRADIEWADFILVMENRYKLRLSSMFRDISMPRIENLDIPDEYQFMDEELIELIEKRVEYYLEVFLGSTMAKLGRLPENLFGRFSL